MKALRFLRPATCETSICDTEEHPALRGFAQRGDELKQRPRAPFVLPEQIDEEKIKRAQLKPKVPNRPANKQKEKKKKHSRVCHQQPPPAEHWLGKFAISPL